MHQSSLARMSFFVEEYASKLEANTKLRVLDVGSYDVNGCYRPLFDLQRYEYVGLDLEEGPNVSIVLPSPYDWSKVETDSFDIVISGQAFEHIEFFWKTMEEMTRVLKKNGLICIVAPNGFAEHRYPVDCYRFFTDGMVALARYVNLEILHAHTNCAPTFRDKNWFSETRADSFLIARKPYSGSAQLPNWKDYRCFPADHGALRSGFVQYDPRKANPLKRMIRSLYFKLFN